MDNFEWKEGYTACFGLVEYHYGSKTYTPRPSAYLYKEIIDNNGCDEDMMKRYNLKEFEL
jgi:beta-glucosidase/6-phospho-beta-glucosidase/beta-galactosidase